MNKNYTGIDYFRFIAALLIIAIHTSPLGSFSETGDFMLTRIIARVAVPFFFMTSGFFLISRYTCNAEKLGAFIKKTICMDQLAVDVTDIPNVKTGSIATLIGKDGKEEITAPMVAESAESITNELLSRMGHRLNIIRRA